jgi:hypothetical protein
VLSRSIAHPSFGSTGPYGSTYSAFPGRGLVDAAGHRQIVPAAWSALRSGALGAVVPVLTA